MFRTLLILIFISNLLCLACKRDTSIVFPEEVDEMFREGDRQVLKPFDDKWVLYYFSSSSPEDIKAKLQSSSFYQSGDWRELKANAPYAYEFGRSGAQRGALINITVVDGRLDSDLINIIPSGGCSLLLVPAPR